MKHTIPIAVAALTAACAALGQDELQTSPDAADANLQRFGELEAQLTDHIADEIGLARDDTVLLHPDFVIMRTLLADAALEAELATELCRECGERRRAGVVQDIELPMECPPDYGQMCQRQLDEMMSVCNAIRDNKCQKGLEWLCKRFRSRAHERCAKIALCQFDCCTQLCSGLNCVNYVIDGYGEKCIACPP